jgi:hypothetical protein
MGYTKVRCKELAKQVDDGFGGRENAGFRGGDDGFGGGEDWNRGGAAGAGGAERDTPAAPEIAAGGGW